MLALLTLIDFHLVAGNKLCKVSQRKGFKCADALNLSLKARLHMVVLSEPTGLRIKGKY